MTAKDYTAADIRLHREVAGYYTTDVLESGSLRDGTLDLHTYTILRTNDETWGVRLDSSVLTASTPAKTLNEARVLIADALNRMNRVSDETVAATA